MRQPLEIPIILRRVRIDGPAASREVDMILDTGAISTVVSWEVARDIGYDPADALERIPVVTANGVIEVPKIRVLGVGLRELYIRDVEVICHDIPEIDGVEGLVGLGFLKHFRVSMDFRAGILEIV
jgi:clan AA aspartic protease (TIGR02281 family)